MKTIKNPELELAYEYVCHTNKHIYLTGKAGTGKTTFLRKICQEIPKRMIVVAPTGVAAINAKGMTIHSLFQLPFGPLPPDKARTELRKRAFSGKKINLIKSLDLLIIDEISMVRADVLDAIDLVLQRYRNSRVPFGGVQLLMIGDLHQLPPVVKDQDWYLLRDHYNTAYFFGSRALQQTGVVTIELKHIYRQSDQHFINILNKVRNNQVDADLLEALNSRYNPVFQPGSKDGYITLTSHNATAQQINQQQLTTIPGVPHRFKAIIEDNFPEHAYPTELALEFKVGAQVMFVKNDLQPERRYYNGKIGTIVQIDRDSITVKCPGDTESILVRRNEWDNRTYEVNPNTKEIEEKIVGKFIQFPLKLAWAITIHKSQGLTFEKVIIDAEASFAHGQVYVALSRCKSFEGVILRSQIRSNSVKTDAVIRNYSAENAQNQPDKAHLKDSKRGYQEFNIRQLFDFKPIEDAFAQLKRAILETEHSLQGGELKEFEALWLQADQKVVQFARKFSFQLGNYFSEGPLPEENEALLTRLKKAGVYFTNQLKDHLLPACKEFQVLSDNKNVQRKVEEKVEALHQVFHVKKAVMQLCEEGFDSSQYLKVKAEAVLDFQNETKTKVKSSAVPKDIEHPALYKAIYDWRAKKAILHQLDPYKVVPTSSLVEMVKVLPTEGEALKRIGKLGTKRINAYGAELLKLIRKYCEQHNLISDQLQFASLKPKSDTKKMSYELFRAGKKLEEIATERSLTLGTIQTHLGHYVHLGELDIYELLDQSIVDDVMDYYNSEKSNRLNDAKAHFGERVTFGDLRLIYRHWEKVNESA